MRPNPLNSLSLVAIGTAYVIIRMHWKDSVAAWLGSLEVTCAVCLLLGEICLALFASFSIVAFRWCEFFFSLLPLSVSFLLNINNVKPFRIMLLLASVVMFAYISIFKQINVDPMLEGHVSLETIAFWLIALLITFFIVIPLKLKMDLRHLGRL